MVGFAIDGLISSLNTTEIIDALLSTQRAPATRLAARRDATTSKLTALQALNASVLGIQVAAQSLSSVDSFRGRIANSTKSDIATATAASDAELGSFTLSVQQLARARQISSDPNNVFSDPDASLNIEGAILVNDRTVSIRLTDSLRDVASRISNAGAGVSASVIEVDDGQFRLSVRSSQTGADSFSLTNASSNDLLESLRLAQTPAADVIANPITDGAASREFNIRVQPISQVLNLDTAISSGTISIANGSGSINVAIDLSTQNLDDIVLAIEDAANAAGSSIAATVVEVEQGVFQLQITSGDATTPTFTDSNNVLETLGVLEPSFIQVDQQGLDSQFTVNGIQVVRSGNLVSDVIEGVSISLLSDDDPAAETTITVTSDESGAGDAVQSFIDAFNSTRSTIQRFAFFNAETQQAGVLLGDSAVLSVESGLSSLIFRSISVLPSQRLETLNSGAGVAAGTIRITDRSGTSADIDLTSAATVQDVLDAINLNNDIQVEASVNRNGTGIDLRDVSGGVGTLSVQETGGGTTAADLGILGSAGSTFLSGSAIAEARFLSLSQLGVSINLDGSLSFDRSEFDQLIEDDFEAVEGFFRQSGGFSEQVEQTVDSLTDSQDGLLTIRAQSLEDTIENFNDSIENILERVALAEQRLRRQFIALEQSLAQLQNEGSFLLSQLDQISLFSNRSGNNRNR